VDSSGRDAYGGMTFEPAARLEVHERLAAVRLGYRPELDGIRGVAILLVVAGHYRLVPPFAGIAGVTVFFVLSGYLITRLVLAEARETGRIDLRAFYRRRMRRLFPALVAAIVVTGVVVAIASPGEFAFYPFQAAIAASYLANFAPGGGASLGPLGHTWTLAIEEQFYLVWPGLFVLLKSDRARLIVLGLGIAWAIGIGIAVGDVLGRSDFWMEGLLLGCAIAIRPIALPRWTAVAGAALIGLAVVLTNDLAVGMPVVAVATALLILGGAPLTWAPLVKVGAISYAIYLYHPVFLWLGWWRTPILIPVGLLLTAALALASDRWLERRFRKPRAKAALPSARVGRAMGVPAAENGPRGSAEPAERTDTMPATA
jgi:peptidoglycan/LPS O-acetylase OafA/YrhL